MSSSVVAPPLAKKKELKQSQKPEPIVEKKQCKYAVKSGRIRYCAKLGRSPRVKVPEDLSVCEACHHFWSDNIELRREKDRTYRVKRKAQDRESHPENFKCRVDYNFFQSDKSSEIRAKYIEDHDGTPPNLVQLNAEISKAWDALTKEQKEPYVQMALKEREHWKSYEKANPEKVKAAKEEKKNKKRKRDEEEKKVVVDNNELPLPAHSWMLEDDKFLAAYVVTYFQRHPNSTLGRPPHWITERKTDVVLRAYIDQLEKLSK